MKHNLKKDGPVWAFILVMVIFFSVLSCTQQYKVPSGIMPMDQMESVLWDMIQADRYATSVLSRDSSKNLKEETLVLYEEVFSIHKVSRQQFIKSFKFYLERPDISQVMLDSLATKANRRRDEIYRPKPDSTSNTAPQTK